MITALMAKPVGRQYGEYGFVLLPQNDDFMVIDNLAKKIYEELRTSPEKSEEILKELCLENSVGGKDLLSKVSNYETFEDIPQNTKNTIFIQWIRAIYMNAREDFMC